MNTTQTTEAQHNPYMDAFNYLLTLAQDYVNTLPTSAKIAVAKEAQLAFESYKQLIEQATTTDESNKMEHTHE